MPPPLITPANSAAVRPLISVMFPVYHRTAFLEQALKSVIDQGFPAHQMEIAVVDDCSPGEEVRKFVASLRDDRIQYFRNEKNLGISGNFNRCIELARGHWVHIFHSDDFVLPGFYDKWKSIFASNPVDAVVFRCNFVDDQNRPCENSLRLSDPDSPNSASIEFDLANPLKPLRNEFLELRPMPCVGMVVRRSVYESIGGFLTEFGYSLDVEMMSRIFFNRPTFFCNERLASFRIHPQSAGARLRNGLVNAEFYALAPYLQHNMNLSAEELKRYRLFCHKAVRDRCKELADSGNVAAWWFCQKLYARHLESPKEYLDYILRTNRCLIRYLRARIGFPVS